MGEVEVSSDPFVLLIHDGPFVELLWKAALNFSGFESCKMYAIFSALFSIGEAKSFGGKLESFTGKKLLIRNRSVVAKCYASIFVLFRLLTEFRAT